MPRFYITYGFMASTAHRNLLCVISSTYTHTHTLSAVTGITVAALCVQYGIVRDLPQNAHYKPFVAVTHVVPSTVVPAVCDCIITSGYSLHETFYIVRLVSLKLVLIILCYLISLHSPHERYFLYFINVHLFYIKGQVTCTKDQSPSCYVDRYGVSPEFFHSPNFQYFIHASSLLSLS